MTQPSTPTLRGQRAWITGGGSGIGLAAATALARQGVHVVISGRDHGKLVAAVQRAEAQGSVPPEMIRCAGMDVADRAQVAQVGQAVQDLLGGVDILVNSAGTNVPRRHWGQTDAATFEQVLAVNLNGAAWCTMAVLAGMRARGRGTVINVASFVGWHLGRLTGPAYTASKAGLIALTHSFNLEEGANGLRATALCPGEVATPIMLTRPVVPTADEQARMLQEADLGRTIQFIAELPPHVCINELVITPVLNRLYGAVPG